jgi:hypothetical protein
VRRKNEFFAGDTETVENPVNQSFSLIILILPKPKAFG